MGSKLTPLGMVIKWFIVPLSLGAIGYYMVGPRVESKVPAELRERVQEVTGQKSPDTSPEQESEKPKRDFSEPQVDVTVTALNTRRETPKRKRKRRRRPTTTTTAPVQTPTVPVSAEPPPSTGDGA